MGLARAKGTFWVTPTVLVHQGDVLDDAAAVVVARPDLFEPVVATFDIEQATAAPGERRRVHRGGKGKGKPVEQLPEGQFVNGADLPPAIEGPATGEPRQGIEVPADGTPATLEVEDPLESLTRKQLETLVADERLEVDPKAHKKVGDLRDAVRAAKASS